MKPRVICKYREDITEHKIFCHKTHNLITQPYKCCKDECKYCDFPTLAKVTIEVGRCDECPFCNTRRTMGAGEAFDYLCGKMNNKQINGYVEYMSELGPVPKWCPFYIKEMEVNNI